jgi:hypothetical protein
MRPLLRSAQTILLNRSTLSSFQTLRFHHCLLGSRLLLAWL